MMLINLFSIKINCVMELLLFREVKQHMTNRHTVCEFTTSAMVQTFRTHKQLFGTLTSVDQSSDNV